MRHSRALIALVVLVVAASGCSLFGSASRYAAAPGTVDEPFWCAPTGGTALTASSCQLLSSQLDLAVLAAEGHFTAAQATAGGATGGAYQAGTGAPFRFSGPTSTFDARNPDTLLYDGTGTNAQVAGIEYNVTGASAPAGFEGDNDTWVAAGAGVWRLRVWILRPFQDENDVFATSHPCLDAAGPIYDFTASCYTSTHRNPLEVLVSNDDGFNAPGIDAMVEALRVVPGVHVTVSAPATNQSGAGSSFTNGPVTETDAVTASGYPVWSVAGFPVDSVRYALRTRHLNPDVLVSGTNNGQNIGVAVPLSGTIGAAREGAQNAIPALAISQGIGSPPNFPASVPPLMAWFNDFVYGRAGRPFLEPVTNINVPTCTSGTIRGTVHVPVAPSFAATSNCTSTLTPVTNDVEAFANGFVSVSNISAKSGASS